MVFPSFYVFVRVTKAQNDHGDSNNLHTFTKRMAERALLRSQVQSTDRCVDGKESEEGPPAFLVQHGEAIDLVAGDT